MLWAIVAYGMLIFMAAFCTGLVMRISCKVLFVLLYKTVRSLQTAASGELTVYGRKWNWLLRHKSWWSGRWGAKRRDIGMLNNATISIIYGDG